MMTQRSDPRTAADGPASLVDLARARAEQLGDKAAYTFLRDSELDEARLSYRELDRQARAVAVRLLQLADPGARALLVYPPGLEYIAAFFGCLYAGVVAVPVHPPRPYRPMPRLQAIIADAAPALVLSTAALAGEAPTRFAQAPELVGLPWLATDTAADGPADGWRHPGVGPDSLAFLQYTSGSTAAPKGVMVSHGNLLHNSRVIRQGFETTAQSRGVFWLPHYHDMGLIGGVLQTLYCGGSSTLLSPVAFLQRPLVWLQAISRTRATVSGAPDFAYDLCVRKVAPDDRADLDLRSWEVAFTGAEPVRAETLDRFATAFAGCGFRREAFYPCYGLAEATLMASGGRKGTGPVVAHVQAGPLTAHRVVPSAGPGPDTRPVVGCGRQLAAHRLLVVDPEQRTACPPSQVGEIWVGGPSVAHGYHRRPDESLATFGARLADGAGPFLRTGDLGFLWEGELFVVGRLKDLVIIRGRNHYPHDIEWSVGQSHPKFRLNGAAAFAVELAGRERLVVVQEVERHFREEDADDAVVAVRRTVADQHEVEVHAVVLVKAGAVPRTSSGKIQRHLCRQHFLGDDLDVVARWTQPAPDDEGPAVALGEGLPATPARHATAAEVEAWLCERLSERLALRRQDFDAATPFVSMGLTSVEAVTLISRLEEWLGRRLSPTLIYNYPTVGALARHLAGENGTGRARRGPAAADLQAQALREVKALSDDEMVALIVQASERLR